MNFLAHLHIADHCQSDLQGNLLGDFVKGDPTNKFPFHVTQGIRLHRFVDRFTDTHPIVTAQKHHFGPELRRFSPIALDMFWDHCLAKYWSNYHDLTLNRFVEQCRNLCQSRDYAVPDNYLTTMNAMWKGEWLLSYQDLDSILYALERMSHRSQRMAPLAECGATLVKQYDLLSGAFLDLYPQVLNQSEIFTLNAQKV